jgi:hypothetical protein
MDEVKNSLFAQGLHSSTAVLLIILGSDETRITRWTNQSVHPLYLWLGNSSQNIRNSNEGRILIGYFPVLEETTNITKSHLAYYRCWLIHTSLSIVLSPLKKHQNIGL